MIRNPVINFRMIGQRMNIFNHWKIGKNQVFMKRPVDEFKICIIFCGHQVIPRSNFSPKNWQKSKILHFNLRKIQNRYINPTVHV